MKTKRQSSFSYEALGLQRSENQKPLPINEMDNN